MLSLPAPAPLRLPLFRAWWLTAQGSNAGTWMQQVAAAWLMLDATGSAAMVGVLGLAQRGPALFLTPLAGRLADRRDRRTLLSVAIALQFVAAIGLTVAAVAGAAIPSVLIALSLVGGIGQTARLARAARHRLEPRPAVAPARRRLAELGGLQPRRAWSGRRSRAASC